MRIIAGSAKGLRLKSPKGQEIRPTLDRVRESVFNVIGPSIVDAAFLDLFAGAGANGLEALSRGARRAVLVDAGQESQRLMRENLARTRLNGGQILRLRLPGGLHAVTGPFDYIYADPPYDFMAYEALLLGLQEHALLEDEGKVFVEHARQAPVPEAAGGLVRARVLRFGGTHISIFS